VAAETKRADKGWYRMLAVLVVLEQFADKGGMEDVGSSSGENCPRQ
jgi:hypothetical protein